MFYNVNNVLSDYYDYIGRAKVKTKHDRAELMMRALQFTADRGVSYSRQFRGKNLTKTQFSSFDERNSTPRSSTFLVESLIEH
jgi:hypothetical protein